MSSLVVRLTKRIVLQLACARSLTWSVGIQCAGRSIDGACDASHGAAAAIASRALLLVMCWVSCNCMHNLYATAEPDSCQTNRQKRAKLRPLIIDKSSRETHRDMTQATASRPTWVRSHASSSNKRNRDARHERRRRCCNTKHRTTRAMRAHTMVFLTAPLLLLAIALLLGPAAARDVPDPTANLIAPTHRGRGALRTQAHNVASVVRTLWLSTCS